MNGLTSRKRLTSNVDAGADEAEECGSGSDERGGRSTKTSALAAATLRDGFALNSSHKVSQLVAQKRRRNKPYCVAACPPSIPKAAWANMHWKQRRKALQRLSSTVNDAGTDEVLVDSGSDEQAGPAAKPDAGPPPPVSAAAAAPSRDATAPNGLYGNSRIIATQRTAADHLTARRSAGTSGSVHMSSDEGGRFEDEDGESEVSETPDIDVPVGAPAGAGARDAPLLSSGHRFVDGTGAAGTSRVPSAAFEAMFGRTPGGMPAETATVGAFASPSSSPRDLSLSKPVSAKNSGLSVEAADDRGPYAAIPSSTTTSCGAANQPAISQLPVDDPFQSLALPSLLASRAPLSRLHETQLSLSHCAEANSGPATPSSASLASPSLSAGYGGSILEANTALAAIARTAVTAALPSLGPSGSRIPEPLTSVNPTAVEQAVSMPADSSAYSSAAAFALADRFRGRLVALRSHVDLAEHLGKQLAEVQQRCTATVAAARQAQGVAAVATAAAAAAAHAAVAAEEREAAERAAEQRAALAASKALAAAKLAARIAEAVASEAAAAKQLAVECAAAELGAAVAAAAAQRAAEEATSSAQTLKAELDVLTVALKDYV